MISPRLRILITKDDKRHIQGKIPYLEAKDFIDAHCHSGLLTPWASEMTLKVFKTKITCIPRPDVIKHFDEGQHTDTLTEITT
ncbi:hypothetical protein BG005_007235 [Podila minutissima]|nr:hypothetical protein BG005_007235 [Podila minutissima]